MLKLLTLGMMALLLNACSSHRIIRVRCTDRLEPINRVTVQNAATPAAIANTDRSVGQTP